MQMLFHRTSALVAYENPLEAGGDVSRLAGQEAREELAIAVNEGILGTFFFFASSGLVRRTEPDFYCFYLFYFILACAL